MKKVIVLQSIIGFALIVLGLFVLKEANSKEKYQLQPLPCPKFRNYFC